MQDLGEFLFQISRKKKENFELISGYCQERSGSLVDLLRDKLSSVVGAFSDIMTRISPGKMQLLEGSYSPSQDEAFEEEKNEMVIDTTTQPLHEFQKPSYLLRLPDEEEKLLKGQLRLQESSEVLLRLFKLYNLFYEKFSAEKKPEEIEQTDPQAVVAFIH